MNSLYEIDIRHVRGAPVRHQVAHRSYQWFVDLDDLPRLPWPIRSVAQFRATDHVGSTQSLRANIDEFLGANGIDLHGGSITMLTNARSLGYVFNPLTLYWCHDPDSTLRAVVAEVHNTYSDRHRYLLQPDEMGRAETEKQFYVSPFYPVDGYYRMSVPEPGERLSITITLHRDGQPPFTASLRGSRRPATTAGVLRAVVRRPFENWRVRALIQLHGIRLYLKGLRVAERPPAPNDPHTGAPRATRPTESPRPEENPMPARRAAADRIAGIVKESAGLDLPVRIRAWDGSEAGPTNTPVLLINNRRALRRLLWSPNELGLARAYITGDLDVDGDIVDGFRLAWRAARRNNAATVSLGLSDRLRAARSAVSLGIIGARPATPASEAKLRGRLHSRKRDRDAISHHYDLSNEFYELLLDESMAYSSAYFTSPDETLESAQRAKLDLICRKLDLKPGMRLLDVGCGWGSLILHAAEHYGVQATGVTLSQQQRDFVAKRVAERGLADRVTVRLQDYREIPSGETFDAVSSIEMGEHVGQVNYGSYAATLHDHLVPTGRLLLQQMSRHAGTAPGGGAFIESYIAPDMHMRPLAETLGFLEAAGLEIRDVEAMREHYVRTVAGWIDRFERRYDEVTSLVGEEVARVWRLYLVGGALSFEEGRMGVDQILAVRATSEGESSMPADRPWARG
ncbi:Cyclopropane fatty-acyl-phospholipid synthase [Frankineae bacterium MT45]|nr:Cyclopropane fatty-acyl-phospholipid synthase [Frankineae bacterium MT45]